MDVQVVDNFLPLGGGSGSTGPVLPAGGGNPPVLQTGQVVPDSGSGSSSSSGNSGTVPAPVSLDGTSLLILGITGLLVVIALLSAGAKSK